tara:strand:- start:148 stop:288 length:141 start_codon:yes stop_codon:yes gene_type:complete
MALGIRENLVLIVADLAGLVRLLSVEMVIATQKRPKVHVRKTARKI